MASFPIGWSICVCHDAVVSYDGILSTADTDRAAAPVYERVVFDQDIGNATVRSDLPTEPIGANGDGGGAIRVVDPFDIARIKCISPNNDVACCESFWPVRIIVHDHPVAAGCREPVVFNQTIS